MLTIAAVKLPNMSPNIKREVLLLSRAEAIKIKQKTKKLPKVAAIIIDHLNPTSLKINQLPSQLLPIRSSATPRLAPELIPRT